MSTAATKTIPDSFITRAYNSIEVNEDSGIITKRSTEERLGNEISHYKRIPSSLEIWFPRRFNSGRDKRGTYFLELELYAYENLGTFLTKGSSGVPDEEWRKIAQLISVALVSFSESAMNTKNLLTPPYERELLAMYKIKTLKEYQNLKNNFEPFGHICSLDTLVLNGVEYENFERLWAKNEGRWLEILQTDSKCTFFHGDCCFSNILIGGIGTQRHVIKFLDPRGRFGSLMAYGDPYYDLAKLMHSTDVGYEYFITDQFEVSTIANNEFTLGYDNQNKERVHRIFTEEIYSKFDEVKIKLIQGLVYIGMCARHYDNSNRQLAMYLSGVKVLNEIG